MKAYAALAAFLLIPVLARANGELTVLAMLRPPPPTTAPAPPPPPDTLHIAHQRVTVRIADHAAVTQVDQQFTNPLDAVLEGQYTFRLAPQASVSDFAIWDGKTRVPAVIRRREDARAVYDAIVGTKRDPGLLEQVAENLFTARVFPIPPRSDKRIDLEYRESLRVEDGIACYRYPLTGAPITELAITLDIRDSADLVAAWSPTPGVAVHHHSPHHLTVSYEARKPTSDLLVYYAVRRPDSGLKLLSHRPDPTKPGTWMLSISPPATGHPRRAKDVVFVVDTSGSMEGAKLAQARKALAYCLDALGPGDRFNLVRFGSDATSFSPHMLLAKRAELAPARAWVEALRAEGSTNFEAALNRAMSSFSQVGESRPRYVVFVTDGEPTQGIVDSAQLRELARTLNTGGARLFTFGIDDAQHLPLLAALAADHRGEPLSVKASDDLSTQLPMWVKRLTVPLFEGVRLEWSGVSPRAVHPAELPHFYLGRQLTVVGRYDAPATGQVTLHARVDGEAVSFQAPVAFPEKADGAPQIARIWAQQEADALPPDRSEEIIKLSMEHRFVTPFTSLIAVPDAEREKLPDGLKRVLAGEPGASSYSYEEIEVASLLQIIGIRGGFNVVVDPRVRQKMTVNLKDVEPVEALETIAKLNGLRIKKIEGKRGVTYAVAPPEIIEKGFDTAFTRAVQLEHARADDVARLIARNLGQDTAITVEKDARTNKLVLRGTEEVLKSAVQTIRALDRPDVNKSASSIQVAESVDVYRERPKKPPVPKYDIDYLRGSERRAVPVRLESVSGTEGADHKIYYEQKEEAIRQIKEEDFSAGLRDGPLDVRPPLPEPSAPPTVRPEPPPSVHAMDYQFRLLQQRAATLRLKLALLRARAARPPVFIESVRIEPELVQGGRRVKLSLTVKGGGAVTWSARAGTLIETRDDGAIWEAPRFPGVHVVEVRLGNVSAAIEVVVFEPGQITYSVEYLQARIEELTRQVEAVIAEQRRLAEQISR